MHKILVVDDIAALRQHALTIVERTVGPVESCEAQTGLEGLSKFRSFQPDLIIMDILMPDLSGIKSAQQIWEEQPKTKILFWSQFHRESYVREIGKIVPDEAIHGYALKSESDDKLAYAIDSVLIKDNPCIDPIVRGVQHSLRLRNSNLNEAEQAILIDVVLGLTDKAIAMREHISVRGAQNRISALSVKLVKGLDTHAKESAGLEVFNTRVRIILEAFRQELISPEDVDGLDKELFSWMARRLNFDRPPES